MCRGRFVPCRAASLSPPSGRPAQAMVPASRSDVSARPGGDTPFKTDEHQLLWIASFHAGAGQQHGAIARVVRPGIAGRLGAPSVRRIGRTHVTQGTAARPQAAAAAQRRTSIEAGASAIGDHKRRSRCGPATVVGPRLVAARRVRPADLDAAGDAAADHRWSAHPRRSSQHGRRALAGRRANRAAPAALGSCSGAARGLRLVADATVIGARQHGSEQHRRSSLPVGASGHPLRPEGSSGATLASPSFI